MLLVTICMSHSYFILRYDFAAQVAPSPFANGTPIEVTNAMQHNQLILVSIAMSMNSNLQQYYTENGKLGWPVPNLKQIFTTAVAYIKKFKNGIISSWEGYTTTHKVCIFFYTNSFVSILIYQFNYPECRSCHIELSVDSSLGHATVYPAKRHR